MPQLDVPGASLYYESFGAGPLFLCGELGRDSDLVEAEQEPLSIPSRVKPVLTIS